MERNTMIGVGAGVAAVLGVAWWLRSRSSAPAVAVAPAAAAPTPSVPVGYPNPAAKQQPTLATWKPGDPRPHPSTVLRKPSLDPSCIPNLPSGIPGLPSSIPAGEIGPGITSGTGRIGPGELAATQRRLQQTLERRPWYRGIERRVSSTGAPVLAVHVTRGYERCVPNYFGGVQLHAVGI